MSIFLKFKKRNFTIYLFLIFNQFILSSNALTFEKVNLVGPKRNIIQKKNNDGINISSSNKTSNSDNSLIKEAEELEKFVEETFGSNEFEKFIDQNNEDLIKYSNTESSADELINKEIKNGPMLEKKEIINKKKNTSQNLPLPSRSIISTSEFKFPSRGYVKLIGPYK